VRKHWPRVLGGLAAAAYLLYLGIDGIVSRVSFSIATALVSGSIGRSFSYTVYGTQAIVMGIGWISAATAVLAGYALPPEFRHHRALELARDLGILGFAVCFVYVAFQSVKTLLFG
jgi:hypothetical protein